MKKTILDLCGGTGAWSRPYKEAGYDVRVITWPQEDVRFFEKWPKLEVHGILAAPPCTVFSLAGNRWLRSDKEMLEGISVVDACIRIIWAYKPKWWALENPVGKLSHWLGKAKFIFDPWMYGDPYFKKTALWGEFTIPVKTPVKPKPRAYPGAPDWHHNQVGGKSARTKEIRSMTPAGFANAFFKANQ